MTEPDLNPCNIPAFQKDPNVDLPPPYCRETGVDGCGGPIKDGQKDVLGRDLSWLEEATYRKEGIGQANQCDPMTTGHIIQDQGFEEPNRNTIYRYSKSIRGTDEGVMDLFRDIVVIDEQTKAHNVPIIWATQEKAVAWMLQDNTRKDESLVVDRIRLPIMAIHSSDMQFNQGRYVYHKAVDYLRDHRNNWRPGFVKSEKFERDTVFGVAKGIPVDISYSLYIWTLYEEDMNQIVEQILQKTSPMAYIRVRGISWEVGVKINSIANNVDLEPGDQAVRVFKYQFGFTAESFVAQPIVRKKAVLKTSVQINDAIEDEDITQVIARLEESVKELE